MGLDRNVLFALATSQRWERSVRAVPVVDRLAWRAASRYVAGVSATSALDVARQLEGLGAAASIDCFGELVEDIATADRVTEEYTSLIDGLDGTKDVWPAIDLSHLGLDVDPYGCVERLAAIAEQVPDGRRVQVGAEDAGRADAVLGCVLSVAGRGLAHRLGATVQANLRRSPDDLERLVEAGVHLRLVKGAYVEPADRALPYGEPTDVAYLRLAHRLAEADAHFSLATHDGVLREALLAALGPRQVEQLYGVRPEVVADLVAREIPVRVYVPYGDSWFRYWMRRVAESRGV
ncbi:proline dehydrogenase family protein [Cellulomonas cellasea]|uniref:proline dehydrogenase family protein n=1 Tax=Cellulomonas cellasea TaxID=43670 RepID=UPI0025A4B315|nr:proline dehydrogenase family protein [Cellulomonas cellasea]MDM8085168.1 proline dehydrogenase family protein [Cellulomonas cellasea]